jgi:hypothetical protein
MPTPIAGVFKKVDNVRKMMQGVEALTEITVLVGVPEDKDQRQSGVISNAALAYIHDKGSPAANIPARPFMEPGIKAVQKEIADTLAQAGKAIFKGSRNVEVYLNKVGIIATRSIKSKITEGIAPPLAESTIKGRINRVKGKARRAKLNAALAAGTPGSKQNGVGGLFVPLVVTGQLRNAITYVLRKLRKQK